jgi:spermidine synthase
MSAGRLAGVSLCFLFSGLGSLVLEIAWTRQLRLVFGSTTLAASTILVSYMLGLGLGALAGGRLAARARDAVRTYGAIEIAIGLYALLVPIILSWFPPLNAALLYRLPFWPAALCRFVLSVAVLTPATVLMGASLPVLVRAVVGGPTSGRRVALLYGINTLGAVAGVMAATFVLLPQAGLWRTNAIGAGIDILVGLVAVAVLAGGEPRVAAPAAVGLAPRWHPLLVAYAVVGFSALVLEVGWTRSLAMVFGSSIHAFACMLAAFLGGIGLGSLLVGRRVDRLRRPYLVVTAGIALLGIASLASTLFLARVPQLFISAFATLGSSPSRLVAIHFGLGVLLMLPATLILGALFPVMSSALASEKGNAEAAVGEVYFANTLGSAAGAFLAGFVLIPALGLRGTLALASAVNLAAAGVLLLLPKAAAAPSRWRTAGAGIAFAAAVGLLIIPLPWPATDLALGVFRAPLGKVDVGVDTVPLEGMPENGLVFYQDGLNATVSVEREGTDLLLKTNGKTDASVPGDMATQVLSGHIPLLFGAPAKQVLVIGFASGTTVGSVARHDLERVDVVEIEPAMLAGSRFFEEHNGRPLDDPRVRVIIDDGRTYLSGTAERYDVIASEPSNPWITGVSNLFTREFFQLARHALRPGGRLLQWMQLYGLDPIRLRSILAAVRAEFPTVYLFSSRPNSGDLLILATLEPLRREHLPRWETLSAPIRRDLERVHNYSTTDLWSLMRVLPENVDRILKDATVMNTDDNLTVELSSPWLLYSESLMVNQNWALFRPFDLGVLPLLIALGEPIDAERIGALALSYADQRGDADVVGGLVRVAQSLGPSARALTAQVLAAARGQVTDDALAALDTAVAMAPAAYEPRYFRCALRFAGGRNPEALADANVAVSLAPDDARPKVLRWRILQRLGRLDDAAADLEAIATSPFMQTEPDLWPAAAELHLARGQVDEATRWLRRALEGQPNSAELWAQLIAAYDRAGRSTEAAAARRNQARAARNRVILLQRDGRLAAWRGEWQQARNFFQQALAQDPTYRPVQADLERLQAAERAGR